LGEDAVNKSVWSAYWHIILIVLAVMVCGIFRVAWESPSLPPVSPDTAKAVAAGCFVPKSDIPVGTTITVRRLPASPRDQTIEFVATAPVQIEIAEAKKPKAVLENNVETLTLPAGMEIFVFKSRGDFEFQLKKFQVEVERAGARLRVEAEESPLRFAPIDKVPYIINLADDTKIVTKDAAGTVKPVVLPTGTEGKLAIGDGVALLTLQPVPTAPWIAGKSPNLLPVRATGQKGLSELTVEARETGIDFNASGLAIRACVRGAKDWQPAGVAEVKSQTPGAANIRLNVPADVLPLFEFYTPVELALASSDGRYVGYGGFAAIGRVAAWFIATIFTLALFWWLLNLRHDERVRKEGVTKGDWQTWRMGLFLGIDNQPSLSLFQIFFWTVITIWGLVYVFTVTGSLLSLTAEMMILLGIAGAGSVLARLIDSRPTLPPPPPPPATPSFEFWQILSTNDSFDPLKLQLFVFTIVIGIYVIWRITDTGTFPALDTNMLALLGISQGVYVGGKFAAK
jgi:hypothetical protein